MEIAFYFKVPWKIGGVWRPRNVFQFSIFRWCALSQSCVLSEPNKFLVLSFFPRYKSKFLIGSIPFSSFSNILHYSHIYLRVERKLVHAIRIISCARYWKFFDPFINFLKQCFLTSPFFVLCCFCFFSLFFKFFLFCYVLFEFSFVWIISAPTVFFTVKRLDTMRSLSQ